MATLDIFNDFKDACDELSDKCEQVSKNKEAFTDMAETYQGWSQLYEPVYWKIDDEDLEDMTRQIRDLTDKVRMVIDIELSAA